MGDISTAATLFDDVAVVSLTVTALGFSSGPVGVAVANLAFSAVGLGNVAAGRGVAVNYLG